MTPATRPPLHILVTGARTLGVDPSTTPHYGGHQSAAANTLPLALGHCPTCHTRFVHVVEVELFHRRYSLWACREHPDAAEFRVHQTVELAEFDDFGFDEPFL